MCFVEVTRTFKGIIQVGLKPLAAVCGHRQMVIDNNDDDDSLFREQMRIARRRIHIPTHAETKAPKITFTDHSSTVRMHSAWARTKYNILNVDTLESECS